MSSYRFLKKHPAPWSFFEVVTKLYMRVSKCDDTIMFMQVDWRNVVRRIHCSTQHHIMKRCSVVLGYFSYTRIKEHGLLLWKSLNWPWKFVYAWPPLSPDLLPLECVFVETHDRFGVSRKIKNTRWARRCVLDGIATLRNNHESIRIAKFNQATEVRYDRLTV